MHLRTLSLGLLNTNCHILWNDARQAVIVDPSAEPETIQALIAELGLKPLAILLTHAHFDHIAAVPAVAAGHDLPVYLHERDEVLYHSRQNCMPPWVPEPVADLPPTQRTLPALPADLIPELMETPGHTPGGVAFYYPAAKLALVGDTLFAGSVGRADLPGGDWDTLMHSVRQVLGRLPAETTIYPGHGPASTLEREWRQNPFMTQRA